jgi:hypothetical protein
VSYYDIDQEDSEERRNEVSSDFNNFEEMNIDDDRDFTNH